MSAPGHRKFRIKVKINEVTGDRTYHPQIYDYPQRVLVGGYYGTPLPYWQEIWGCFDRYETDDEGHYVEDVWTLEWATEVIEEEKVRLGWYESHALNDDGTVEILS